MSPMTVGVVIVDIVGVVDKVPTVDVIDVTVPIVIDPVVGNLAGVDPDVSLNVRVAEVKTRIDRCNHDVRTAGGQVPRGFDVDDVETP